MHQTSPSARLCLPFLFILLVIAAAGCRPAVAPEATEVAGEATAVSELPAEEASPTAEATAVPAATTTTTGTQSSSAPQARSHTPTPEATRRATPRPTTPPTPSGPPTATPTSAPQYAPILEIAEPQPVREGVSTPATAIPTAVAPFAVPKGTTNVLLLGSDSPVGDGGVKRTDTMIIVSINRDGPTASMISLPRDLYVYMPGGTMNRLNTAVTLGGVNLLKQTILYNFGIPIHYFARVDFAGFEDIVDAIGGVEITVTCEFKDWRIKSPDLDPEDEENWYVSKLEPGIYQMDGATALWYARSRLMSNDFDRGRRQQQLLRALLNQGVDLGLVAQAPALWSSFSDSVETDMDIGRLLQIASLAPAIRENGVQNLYLLGKTEPWIVPDSNAQVQLPVWEGPDKMQQTFQRLFLPPALNKAVRAPITVQVVNASGNPEMGRLAAENLAWYGFVPVLSEEESAAPVAETTLTYYAPNFKGSYDWLISWVVQLEQGDIVLDEENTAFPYDYQLLLGEDYDSCLNEFYAPHVLLP
jgi:LCP family protein required for cell wall assembly